MRCREVRSKLKDPGVLAGEVSEEIRSHLEECSECAAFYQAELKLTK